MNFPGPIIFPGSPLWPKGGGGSGSGGNAADEAIKAMLAAMAVLLVGGTLIVFVGVMLFGGHPDSDLTGVVDVAYDEYEIVKVHSPKHFRLDLRNTRTGEVYPDVPVSTHFNRWRELRPGMRMSLTCTTWEKKDGTRVGRFDKVHVRQACDRLLNETFTPRGS